MAILRFGTDWSRQKIFKSILLFFVHFIILIGLMAVLVLGNQLNNFSAHMREYGASYLYALFCVLLLILIMYLYFMFEDKRMLSTGKNISLLFTVLDISFVISWVVGAKIDILARPVAVVA